MRATVPVVSRPRRICMHTAITIALAGALTSCGSDDESPSASPQSSAAATTTATTTTRSTTTPPFTPTRNHTWLLAPDPKTAPSADTGQRLYDARIRVELGLGRGTSPADADLPPVFASLTNSCTIDAQRDAIIPLQATLRNDGPVPLETTLSLRVSDLRGGRPNEGDPIPIEAATVFASGPSCEDMSNGKFTTLTYPRVAPDQAERKPYLLVLHNFFSPSYDSGGNVYGLRHLVGLIAGLGVRVAGNDGGNSIHLDSTECYDGTAQQGVGGLGLPNNFFSVRPGFALTEDGFDYEYEHLGASLEQPEYDACEPR